VVVEIKSITQNYRRERTVTKTGSLSFAFTKGVSMSKKKNKAKNNNNQNNNTPAHFELRQIKPLTANQERTFEAYRRNKHLMLHGFAGTGKTFCALYLALEEILSGRSPYNKIIIVRSVVPGRDLGFLPGSIKEKTAIFEEPYREICDDLFGRGDGYEILKLKGLITFTTTSFLRGLTFNNAIVILDESQNLTFQECDTVMTRMGDVSRLIVCGDFRQTDLTKPYEKEGITQLMRITNKINSFQSIEFEKEDIVRSGLVRSYIIAKEERI
jgi:phosphate starvation-inducible protein PhoH